MGVYKDARGNTPVLASVKEAERRLLEAEKTKNYLSIEGWPTTASTCASCCSAASTKSSPAAGP